MTTATARRTSSSTDRARVNGRTVRTGQWAKPGERLALVHGKDYDVQCGLMHLAELRFDRERLSLSRAGVRVTFDEVTAMRESADPWAERKPAGLWYDVHEVTLLPRHKERVLWVHPWARNAQPKAHVVLEDEQAPRVSYIRSNPHAVAAACSMLFAQDKTTTPRELCETLLLPDNRTALRVLDRLAAEGIVVGLPNDGRPAIGRRYALALP